MLHIKQGPWTALLCRSLPLSLCRKVASPRIINLLGKKNNEIQLLLKNWGRGHIKMLKTQIIFFSAVFCYSGCSFSAYFPPFPTHGAGPPLSAAASVWQAAWASPKATEKPCPKTAVGDKRQPRVKDDLKNRSVLEVEQSRFSVSCP